MKIENTEKLEMVRHLGTFHEDISHHMGHVRLTDEQYALATQALPVLCTDIVLIDEQNRFVLTYRKHPAGKGWWWNGGSWKAEFSREESVANILEREISFVPEEINLLAIFEHYWSTRGEKPQAVGRHDMIFLHYVKVDEETIAKIKLDSKEYDAERGFMRYDGSQEVRPVVAQAYELFRVKLTQ